jgi:hypothetical protein
MRQYAGSILHAETQAEEARSARSMVERLQERIAELEARVSDLEARIALTEAD